MLPNYPKERMFANMSGDNSPLVSIVVPVYNVEKFLYRCLESLTGQTYDKLEILLIDDGSTDSSASLCDQFSLKDARVLVVHKDNGGLSDARNVGIAMATGEFVLCVDSDDCVTSDHVELLITSVVEHSADLATTSFIRLPEDARSTLAAVGSNGGVQVLSGSLALEKMFYQRGITTSAWGKIYRRSLFAGVSYPFGHIHEDLGTTYKIFLKAAKVVVRNERTYCYTERAGSITGAGFTVRRLAALDFARQAISDVAQADPRLIVSATNRLFMEAVFILSAIPAAEQGKNINIAQAWSVIRETRLRVLRDKKGRPNSRVFAFASFFGVRTLVAVYAGRALISRAVWRNIGKASK